MRWLVVHGLVLALVGGLMGCGRIAFEDVAQGRNDASGTDGIFGVDCWSAWRSGAPTFSAPERLALSTPLLDANSSLSADALTVFFDSGPAGDADLQVASRASRDLPFGAAKSLSALNTQFEESRLSVTGDGLIGVMASTRPGAPFNLFQTQRASVADDFGAPSSGLFGAINSDNNEFDPELTAEGLRLYYSASAVGGQDLFVADRSTRDAPFLTSSRLKGLGVDGSRADLSLSPDELVIVFSSNSVGGPLQLFFGLRADRDGMFAGAIPLTSISSNALDADPELSFDGCELFFASTRSGDRDLWRAVVQP